MRRQRWHLVWYFLVLIVCWINLTFASLGEHDIPDDWVDPTDMLDFDYGSKTNKKSVDSVREEPPPSIADFEVRIHLKETAWNSLKSYGQNCGANVQEVTVILESMIKEVHIPIEATDPWTPTFEYIFRIQFQDALKVGIVIFLAVAALSLEVISRISWSVQIRRFFILAFLISFAFTYIHEITLAEARYRSKATRIPKECQGDRGEQSIWEFMKGIYRSWFSVEEDPCVKYHAHFLGIPYIVVTPLQVLAVTLTRFAVEPFEHVGSAFGKAFKNIFIGLPVALWVPAFLFAILVIFGLLLIVAGVYINKVRKVIICSLMSVKMGPQQAIQHNLHMNQILADDRQNIDQLQATIRELRDRLQQHATATAPPDPDPTREEAASGAQGDHNYIGFERMMEREERDITDPGRSKISRHAGGEPAPESYDAAVNHVEEVVPQRPRGPLNTTEVRRPKASPKFSPKCPDMVDSD